MAHYSDHNRNKKQNLIAQCCLLYHPDYHRRLWSFTKSADLSKNQKRSRAVVKTNIQTKLFSQSPPVGNYTPSREVNLLYSKLLKMANYLQLF